MKGLGERALSVLGAFFYASVLIHHWPEAINLSQHQSGLKAIRMTKFANEKLLVMD